MVNNARPACAGSPPRTSRSAAVRRADRRDGKRASDVITRIRSFAKKAPPKDWLT